MPDLSASTTRLRRIGRALRDRREAAGMTLQAAGRKLERSGSSLSLIENGQQALRCRDLKHILEVYGVPDPDRSALLTLAAQDRQPGWWDDFKDIATRSDRDHASLERDATLLETVETQFIPGLLQTEDYAHAIMRSGVVEQRSAQADRYVAYRMARQRILSKPDPPKLHVVIDEAALRRTRGSPSVMRAQLRRLNHESEREHVTVQVLPFECAADPGVNGAFVFLEIGRPAIFATVLVDHLGEQQNLDGDANAAHYREVFHCVCAASLSETDSRALIHGIMSEL